MRPSLRRAAIVVAAFASLAPAASAQQVPDSSFHPVVAHPAYGARRPVVRVDEAHHNFHTITGRYQAFAELLRADGYRVEASTAPFTAASLRGADVIVIANALGEEGMNSPGAARPAFTPAEVSALREWVARGGSLLLIADHAPFGSAAEALGSAFGVMMGKGFARDTAANDHVGNPTLLRFARDNGLLGDHVITRGRNPAERVDTVIAFTGQSLSGPEGATVLLRLAPTAEEQPMRPTPDAPSAWTPVAGRAQGLALTVGRGRVVVLGEAALFSAQLVRRPSLPTILMGMNAPGSNDQQFCLNVVHWLSHLLDEHP